MFGESHYMHAKREQQGKLNDEQLKNLKCGAIIECKIKWIHERTNERLLEIKANFVENCNNKTRQVGWGMAETSRTN